MDLNDILEGLEQGLAAATKIAGPLAAVGVPYAGVAKALLEVAENVRARIEDGAVVAAEKDRARIADIITSLQAANDRLAAEIDAS
jgi:hypothetical protein